MTYLCSMSKTESKTAFEGWCNPSPSDLTSSVAASISYLFSLTSKATFYFAQLMADWKDKAFSWPKTYNWGDTNSPEEYSPVRTQTPPLSQPTWPAAHVAITTVPSVAQGSAHRPYPYTTLPQGKRGLTLSSALTTQPLPDVGNDSARQKRLSDPASHSLHVLGHIHHCHADCQPCMLFYRLISLHIYSTSNFPHCLR